MASTDSDNTTGRITWRALLLGTVMSAVFAFVTVYFENRKDMFPTATQIAALPYVLLFFSVLVLNPLLRLLRVVRALSPAEVLIIFIMGSVSAGCSTFGLASQLVPLVSSLFNRHWNNDQTQWNRYVEPFVNDSFFLAEDGIREAAAAYYAAVTAEEAAQAVYDSALRRQRAETALASARQAVEETPADDEVQAAVLRQSLATARLAATEAEERWRKQARASDADSLQQVLDNYPERLRQLRGERAAAKEALATLEKKAFTKVEVFRRGLPKDLRAFPGIAPLPSEGFSLYAARLKRLRYGLAAAKPLRHARQQLQAASGDRQAVAAGIAAAAEDLRPIAQATAVEERQKQLEEEWKKTNARLIKTRQELAARRAERRAATASAFSRLDTEIGDLGAEAEKQDRRREELDEQLRQCKRQLDATARVAAAVTALRRLAADVRAEHGDVKAWIKGIDAQLAQFRYFDASLRRFFIGDVPWGEWLRPLCLWAVLIALTYVVLMTFNVLIFRQWAHNERLIYPLAELPKILAGGDAAETTGIPAVFRSGLFWLGFAISGTILGWNLLCFTELIPGLTALDMRNSWDPYVQSGLLSGLRRMGRCHVFFTMIGFAFLIPARISLSLWLFTLLFMLQLLVLVWSGHGVNYSSFPSEWYYTFNFRMAEGGGAMLIFSAFILFKCRKYLVCCLNPASVAALEPAERTELRWSSFLFLAASVGLILGLWLGLGANLWYTIFSYFIILMITVGLVRAVTEGGILGFQAWVSPFHFIRTVFGMNRSWTFPPLFTPLMVYYAVLFLDIKTFIAPTMANSIKIRDDLKMKRKWFHLAVAAAIVIACVTAVAVHIMLAYNKGADAMDGWFYSTFPKDFYNRLASITQTLPVDHTACRSWILFGAALMAALLFLRQTCFWLPHPIGLIMLVNPIMPTYWFSIFIGWAAKSLVTKYGNKTTYEKVKNAFIGLIAGELTIVVLAMVLAYVLDTPIPIGLNRN